MHTVMLDCDLFQGRVALALRPALSIEGVFVIPGNNLAGARMWADIPLQLVVASVLLIRSEPDENEHDFPRSIYSLCSHVRGCFRVVSAYIRICHICQLTYQ